jgi:hypothetical protein
MYLAVVQTRRYQRDIEQEIFGNRFASVVGRVLLDCIPWKQAYAIF